MHEVTERKPTRSAPKKRLRTIADLDGRTIAAKAARDLVRAITADLGSDLSAAQAELVQRAALLGAFLSDCEARWLAGDDVDLPTYLSACDRQRRVLQSLGLRRVPKPGAVARTIPSRKVRGRIMTTLIIDAKTPARLAGLPPDAKINPQLALARLARQKRPVEHAEDYPHVVVVLDAKTRVIECADGIQWIVQRRTGSLKTPWAGRSFCRTKEALIRIAGSHPSLEALPGRFPERAVA